MSVAAKVGIEGDKEIEAKLLEVEAKANATSKKAENTVNDTLLAAVRKADASGASIRNELESEIDAALVASGIDVSQFKATADVLIQQVKSQTMIVVEDSQQKLARVLNECRAVKQELDTVVVKGEITKLKAISIMHHAYGMFTQVMNVFGATMPPLLSGIVSMAFTVATTLMSMAQAQATNPWTAVMAAMTFIGAAMALAGAIESQMKQDKVLKDLASAQKAAKGDTSVKTVFL